MAVVTGFEEPPVPKAGSFPRLPWHFSFCGLSVSLRKAIKRGDEKNDSNFLWKLATLLLSIALLLVLWWAVSQGHSPSTEKGLLFEQNLQPEKESTPADVILPTAKLEKETAPADVILPTAKLFLPDPASVNYFLRETELRNPLLDSHPPLRVTRCRSELNGPSYDFYQVEHPGGCNARPGMRVKALREYTGGELFFALQLPWLLYFVTLWVAGLVVFCKWDTWREEKAATQQKELARKPNPSEGEDTSGYGPLYFVLAVVGFLLAFANVSSLMSLETQLPVSLPDPMTSGLNPYLANSGVTLHRCEAGLYRKYDFYVGFPDSCEQIGDPQVGIPNKLREAIEQKSSGEGGSRLNMYDFEDFPLGFKDFLWFVWVWIASTITVDSFPYVVFKLWKWSLEMVEGAEACAESEAESLV